VKSIQQSVQQQQRYYYKKANPEIDVNPKS
jgi:hypothetical protein